MLEVTACVRCADDINFPFRLRLLPPRVHYTPPVVSVTMTIDSFIAAIRDIAIEEGLIADGAFWTPRQWHEMFEGGFSPADAWDAHKHPALRAL